jgi:hypothetical protein
MSSAKELKIIKVIASAQSDWMNMIFLQSELRAASFFCLWIDMFATTLGSIPEPQD